MPWPMVAGGRTSPQRLWPLCGSVMSMRRSEWAPGAWWLRDRVEGNIDIDLLLAHQIASAEAVNGRVSLGLTLLAGATEILTDHVVAATGFDVPLERIDCLEPTLRAPIAPEGPYARLSDNFETSVKGLFIVDLAAAPVSVRSSASCSVARTPRRRSRKPCGAATPVKSSTEFKAPSASRNCRCFSRIRHRNDGPSAVSEANRSGTGPPTRCQRRRRA
jgi:hypothetical protein